MKKENAFAKKAVLIASLTAGVIGLHSIFNDAQSSGNVSNKILRLDFCYDAHGVQRLATVCVTGLSFCVPTQCT